MSWVHQELAFVCLFQFRSFFRVGKGWWWCCLALVIYYGILVPSGKRLKPYFGELVDDGHCRRLKSGSWGLRGPQWWERQVLVLTTDIRDSGADDWHPWGNTIWSLMPCNHNHKISIVTEGLENRSQRYRVHWKMRGRPIGVKSA